MITSDHTLDSRLVVMPHGKPSNCTAIESYSYFDTDEPFKALSLRLGTSPNTLRKWWVEKFGKEAFDARCKRIQAKGAVRFNKTLTGATKKMKETTACWRDFCLVHHISSYQFALCEPLV